MTACGSCGTELRQRAKFCDECGTPTDVPGDTAKYKQVTVLFADVVRSMDIAAAVDVERLHEIMTEVVECSAAVARRYGGTVESTGDGVMAVFGAPVSLEDHAFRACLGALAIHDDTERLAAEVRRRDGITLQLRVGLNSGRVIAGEIGSGSLGYAAVGEPVGFAQRMESAAPPGGVMLSESTAQLVEDRVLLADPEWVHIKGSGDPVCARRLLAIRPRGGQLGRVEPSLVGRHWEMAALDAIVDRTVRGRGGVVNIVGAPGIGKSRVTREAAALASSREVEVYWAFCESHTRDVPFGLIARLVRTSTAIADLDEHSARARLRALLPDTDEQDMSLLDDLLGITEAGAPSPPIDSDARRRRLTALVSAVLSRTAPTLFIIEDAHWIDAVSESLVADFLTPVSHTSSMVLITSRPEYDGSLIRSAGAHSIALVALDDSDIVALLAELLGSDPSVSALAAKIAARAAGNPFFAGEMVRELAQRGVLAGERGGYVCHANIADVSVPATVQAAIAARIDRLSGTARKTLNAAAVIGVRFEPELLAALGIEPVLDELLGAELINQVRRPPGAEYAFEHALIRAVAYESQLKPERAEWHRRVADAIEKREPGSTEENAALIAEHLEAADDRHAAYAWHMRAGTWLSDREILAARASWDRARKIADALPEDDAGRPAMRIAPRSMLCATAGLGRAVRESRAEFAQLRELCNAAGDKASLAIGMTGLVTELLYSGHSREGSRLAVEQMGLLDSVGVSELTLGLSVIPFCNWFDAGEFQELERWSQKAIDLAAGDPAKGNGFGIGSPLAAALAWRGFARCWLNRPGWRQDQYDARATARSSKTDTIALVVAWTHGLAIQYGTAQVDESVIREVEETKRATEGGNDLAVALADWSLGVALLNQKSEDDRRRGSQLMSAVRAKCDLHRSDFLVPIADVWIAREQARCGDRDAALPVLRGAVDELRGARRVGYGLWAAGVFAETMLERGTDSDIQEAAEVINWLTNLPNSDVGICAVTLARLRALLARARGDDDSDLVKRYRDTAEALDFEGHIAWAAEM